MADATPLPPLQDAAENVIIAWGLGWDMEGVLQSLIDALPRTSVCAHVRIVPKDAEVAKAQERSALIARLWQDLLDKDDRTSPAEYPDMALITRDEFEAYVRSVTNAD